MALVPPLAAVDDKVIVMHGTEVPFVVRGSTDSDASKLVGASYVHGIMDGEALLWSDGEEGVIVLG